MRFFATLLFLLTFSTCASAQGALPAPKKIKIYNNSDVTLYPVINVGGTPQDEWLMAWFQVGKDNPTDARRYPRKKVARAYVCETVGLDPHTWVEVTLPLYSRMVAAPKGLAEDEYLNWWNGGRVLFYDDAAQIRDNYAKDSAGEIRAPLPFDPGPTITGGTAKCPTTTLKLFWSNEGLPPEDRSQLMEYTFADAITAKGLPYELKDTNVGYNISSVDQVYLPVAMQPLIDQNTIGYIGTTISLTDFRTKMKTFLADFPGWPVYNYKANPNIVPPPADKPRIPGGATVFFDGYTIDPTIPYNGVLSPQPPIPGGATEKLVALFDNCASASPTHAICTAYTPIIRLFQKNLAGWKAMAQAGQCVAPKDFFPDSKVLMLRKIYGWVPYNEGCSCPHAKPGEKCNANDLVTTAGSQAEFTRLQKSYITQLQDGRYTSPASYDFNPYVKLIHEAKGTGPARYLDMAAYAYSVDDAIGFQSYPADGLIITLAGCFGLSPCEKLDKTKRVIVTMGLPRVGVTYWGTNTRCTPQFTKNFDPKFPTVEFYPTKYPCPFTATDLRGRKYEFVIQSPPPNLQVTACGATDWCHGVSVSEQDGERNYINAPPPSAGPATSSHDYDGNGASDIAWRYNPPLFTPLTPWLMQGSQVLAAGTGWPATPKAWFIAGHRDFDGDGKHDLLWRDAAGNTVIWFMDGGSLVPREESPPGQFLEPAWTIGQIAGWDVVGTGDFNGDGMGDFFWRHTSGATALWLVNGKGRIAPNNPNGSASFGTVPAAWEVAGVGDFDGKIYGKIAGNDQKTSDVLWRNKDTGDIAIWFINGITIDNAAPVANVSTAWQIVGTGDFDGDGKFDILWRDAAGNTAVWLMNGHLIKAAGPLGQIPLSWSVAVTGDYDFDGKSDLLWRDTSGNLVVWFMNGLGVKSTGFVGTVNDAGWQIQAANAD
jgi:hypothetical protein